MGKRCRGGLLVAVHCGATGDKTFNASFTATHRFPFAHANIERVRFLRCLSESSEGRSSSKT
jgi:hypothetical protein